ncbi:MAG TPA: M28 family peptidase [Stenomitos sp.]
MGHLVVRSYLRTSLQQYGSVEEQNFETSSVQGHNLLLKLPGSAAKQAPIIVGAHYDGIPGTPGADDNASGVAVLLLLAEAFASNPASRPIWLVGFDLEEWGMLGGAALARTLHDQQQQIHLMLSLEMLGYRSQAQRYPISGMERFYGKTGDYIALVGNVRSSAKLLKMSRVMSRFVSTELLPVPLSGKILPDTRLSDHSPFWDYGYEAVMVTDTAFLRNPNYHKSSDTIESLDLEFLEDVYRGIEATLRTF